MTKIRGTHSSPGVYTQFTDLEYAAKSLGITKCAVVGETLMGPAFDPTPVGDWSEYVTKFGGTSPELFKDSKYPKYELPYIAKSYLKASDQMYVCRVLGLSGYNAGPAFVITALDKDNKSHIVCVLRSRGKYNKYGNPNSVCDSAVTNNYDVLSFDCKSVTLERYTNPAQRSICDDVPVSGATDNAIYVSPNNLGRFTIVCTKQDETKVKYPVSFNAGAKDYIYDVLGSDPKEGEAPVFVEELYDMYLLDLIIKGQVSEINKTVTKVNEVNMKAICNPVSDFVSIPSANLTKKNNGQTFLALEGIGAGNGYVVYAVDPATGNPVDSIVGDCIQKGHVYIVKPLVASDGKVSYVYVPLLDKTGAEVKLIRSTSPIDIVKVMSMNDYYQLDNNGNVVPVVNNSDYHEMFRCATTPWFVSEIKGDAKTIEVKKLFRFHTISDGTSANGLVKISVTNIRPDDGLFDILVRDFNDTDASPNVLETYRNLSMMPGTPNYIGLRIGTVDGAYETVSNYVLAEIIENDMTRTCVPCGFVGYPTRVVTGLESPTMNYNTYYDEDMKARKQYFGLSDITGVDIDMLYYKGRGAYDENYANGYTNAFHLDSTLSNVYQSQDVQFTIDGDINTKDVKWTTVDPQYDPSKYTHGPIIASEVEMEGCLFEDKNKRKFTVYPCGGFDGWDIYRGARTTGDEFKYNKYKGSIINGFGNTFSRVDDAAALGLDANSITSDYYAYLAGVRQFENPEQTVINLFATPGIDYVNSPLLTDEVIEMLKEKRGDTLYVVTTPDKPYGAGDAQDEMYTSADAVSNLEASDIDTYYAATYYPWVKYYDNENSVYINLPATKDALRNMADVDNKRYPWYAPAGIERGNVECKKMHFFAKIDDEDALYDGRINPLKTFSEDGVKIWGNKTMYTRETPMNRINVVRLMLYMRKLIVDASKQLIFEPNDVTLKDQFENIINPILAQIKNDRGITKYQVKASQTPEQMDQHEMTASVWVKPTPSLEYLEINFIVTPQGVEFEDM